MSDLAETPDEHTQEWSPNARGCPQNEREPLLGTERGWTCDRPSDCDVEPHGSTPRKPLVIERVSSTLRIEGRQEPLGPAYLVMSADDDWGDSVRIDLGIQDARLLSGWLGSWLRNKDAERRDFLDLDAGRVSRRPGGLMGRGRR